MRSERKISAGAGPDAKMVSRWRNAIIVAFGLGGITVVSWGGRMPAIRTELGVGTGTLGVLVACATVGGIGGLFVGRLALHRLGGRRAVMATVLGVALALVVMGVGVASGSVAVVAVGFLFVGLALGALDVSINVEGAAVERTAGRTLMPLMHGAWSVGAGLGAGIGALCAATGVRPELQFIGLAVLVAAIGLGASRDIPLQAAARGMRTAVSHEFAGIRRWLRGWTNRRLLLIGLVLFGVELGEGSANSWLPLAVKQNHAQSAAIAALFLSLFAVSEASSRMFGGPLVDRFGRVRMLRYTTALGIAGVTLFILGGTVWLIALAVGLWGIGVSMGFPLGMSAAAEGGDPASQVSVAASVGYSANLVGPPLIGFLAESVGLLWALSSLAICFLAAFAAAGSLKPLVERPHGDRDQPLGTVYAP